MNASKRSCLQRICEQDWTSLCVLAKDSVIQMYEKYVSKSPGMSESEIVCSSDYNIRTRHHKKVSRREGSSRTHDKRLVWGLKRQAVEVVKSW